VIDEDLDCIEERQLAAGGEDGFIDCIIGAKVAGMALDDGLTDVGDAGNNGVAGEIGLDGDDGRILDVAMVAETSMRPMRSAKILTGAATVMVSPSLQILSAGPTSRVERAKTQANSSRLKPS
jgi:hypothetical protein